MKSSDSCASEQVFEARQTQGSPLADLSRAALLRFLLLLQLKHVRRELLKRLAPVV